MLAINGAIMKVVGIVDRTRGNGGGQDKAVVGINSGMFFKAVMRFIFLHDPIGVQIPRELFGSRPVTNLSNALCLFANE